MIRHRRGFSLLEIQASFVVLGLSVAGLVPFAIAQLKLVATLERRLPPNATFALISNNHQMVTLLAAGSGTTTPAGVGSTSASGTVSTTASARAVEITQVQPSPDGGSLNMVATVTVKKP